MTRTLRTSVLLGVTLALLSTAAPALAATSPTALTAVVGDRVVDLSWSGGDGAGAVVRDVTGVPAPYTRDSGRSVPTSTPTTAADRGFANTATATYAVWSADADGTLSDPPLVTDVAPVPAVATTLGLTASATAVPWGRAVTLTGRLLRTGGAPVAGVPLELYGQVGGTTDVRLLRRVVTGADGVARTSLPPSRTTTFTLRWAGDAFNSAATSRGARVAVLPRATAVLSPVTIVKGETTVLTGRVVPTLSGAPVYVQERSGSTWRNVALLRTTSTSTYRLVLRPTLGAHAYRALVVARPAYLSAPSRAALLQVDARDLASGSTGADVLALQQRLRALHYVPGALDGRYGFDLVHAVMAFQKVERLPVTGRWTKAERTRAGHPTAWRLRYPGPGRAVEVSITRQVLVVSEAGRVVTIIDVSTGTEKPYTYQGESDVAHTPRGRFSIYYKIDGIRVSKLGELYKPSYFVQGWAIHGSGSVPNYPASHGCVRITNPNADRLFPVLVKGTPVALYDE